MAHGLCPPSQSLEAQISCTGEAGSGKEPGYPSSGPSLVSLSLDCFLSEKNKPIYCFLCLLPVTQSQCNLDQRDFLFFSNGRSRLWELNILEQGQSQPWDFESVAPGQSISITQELVRHSELRASLQSCHIGICSNKLSADWRVLWFEKCWSGQSIMEFGFDPRPVCF